MLGGNRLPDYRDKFIMGSGTNVVGTVKSAGLPNITGRLGGITAAWVDGAFGNSQEIFSSLVFASGTSYWQTKAYDGNFNASKSNNIYGSSNTVQPPAICALICIKAL